MTTDEIILPKLPISSFYLFCLDEKPKIIETLPDPTPTFEAVVSKELGSRFLTCPQVNLAKYDTLVKVDYLRYEKELREYHRRSEEKKQKLEDCNSAKVQSSKRKSKAKSKQLCVEVAPEVIIPSPVEPLPSFFWFCLEKKLTAQEQSSTLVDLASTLSQQWQEIPPTVRSKFEALAEIDKIRYEKDLTIYEQKKSGKMPSESDTEMGDGSDTNGCSEDNSDCMEAYTGVADLLEIKLEYASDNDD